jgi:hypothetical protein
MWQKGWDKGHIVTWSNALLEVLSLMVLAKFYINPSSHIAPVTSEVVGSIPGQTHSSCDREGDSLTA